MPEPAIDIDPLVVGDAGGDHAEDDAEDHTEDHAGDRPIALLRWPAQDAERRRLVARGEPRILLISHYGAPPGLLDDLEVWMLEGTEPRELLAAMTTLRRKARQPPARAGRRRRRPAVVRRPVGRHPRHPAAGRLAARPQRRPPGPQRRPPGRVPQRRRQRHGLVLPHARPSGRRAGRGGGSEAPRGAEARGDARHHAAGVPRAALT